MTFLVWKCDFSAFLAFFKITFFSLHNPTHKLYNTTYFFLESIVYYQSLFTMSSRRSTPLRIKCLSTYPQCINQPFIRGHALFVLVGFVSRLDSLPVVNRLLSVRCIGLRPGCLGDSHKLILSRLVEIVTLRKDSHKTTSIPAGIMNMAVDTYTSQKHRVLPLPVVTPWPSPMQIVVLFILTTVA